MAHALILRPLVTEKSLRLAADGKYTFVVNRAATKLSVAQSVASTHTVTVLAVNITKTSAKPKQRGQRPGITKAIVTLKKGDSIKGFELPMPAEHDHKRDEKATEQPAKEKK